MRVLHQHAAGVGFDAADHPRRIAQQHDVATVALHGEIFVDRTHHPAVRLRYDGIQRIIGNSAATGDGRQSGAAPGAQLAIHPIAMQVRSVTPAARRNAFGEHVENRVKYLALQIAVRIRASHESE